MSWIRRGIKEVQMVREVKNEAVNGLAMLLGFLGWIAVWVSFLVRAAAGGRPALIVASVVALVLGVFGLVGLFTVAPNEARVLQLFGAYRGTVAVPGLRWANPFFSKTKISTRTRNFETSKLKVNDNHG